MPSIFKTLALACLAMAPLASASPASQAPRKSHCRPMVGTFNMTVYQLYQESIDFDSIHWKIYASYTLVQYDPYTNVEKIIEFPGLSHNLTFHGSGVDFDARTGAVYVMINSAAPFSGTFGLGLTGPNFIVKYDTNKEQVVYTADLGPATTELSRRAGQLVNGYQDQAEDTHGNTYLVMTFGSALVKVNPKGEVSILYATPASEIGSPLGFGYGGIIALGDVMLMSKNYEGKFVTIDTAAAVPKETTVVVSNQPANITIQCDGILLPSRYWDKVLLCSQDAQESIFVYASNDAFKTAKYIGAVKNDDPLAVGGLCTATVQVADNVFISNMFFSRTGTPGTRGEFPLIDITEEVDGFVKEAGYKL